MTCPCGKPVVDQRTNEFIGCRTCVPPRGDPCYLMDPPTITMDRQDTAMMIAGSWFFGHYRDRVESGVPIATVAKQLRKLGVPLLIARVILLHKD